jgi:hypothetical protein
MINIHTHTYCIWLIWAICHTIMTKISLLSILYLFIIIFNRKEELKINKVEDFKHDEINCNYV